MLDCQAHEEARNTLIDKAMEIMPEFPTLNATHKIKVVTSNINLIRKTAYYLKEMLNKRQYVLFN